MFKNSDTFNMGNLRISAILVASLLLVVATGGRANELCGVRRPSMSEFADFGCNLSVMTNECKDLFYQHPETLPYAKNCERPQLPPPGNFANCASEIGSAWSDLWVKVNRAGKLLDQCDADLECKAKLAKEAYFVCHEKDGKTLQFPCTDEEQLKAVSAFDLLRKRENVRMMAREAKYRQELSDHGVPLPELGNGPSDLSPTVISSAIKARLDELGVKIECYNAEGQWRMACYALGSIVDPLLVVGAGGVALKGGAWSARVLGWAGEEKVAVGATNALKAEEGLRVARTSEWTDRGATAQRASSSLDRGPLPGKITEPQISWGKSGQNSVLPARQAQISKVRDAVNEALAVSDGSDEGRLDAVSALFKDGRVLPKNGVVHIVGPSGSVEEWVIPLLSRPDVRIVMSEDRSVASTLAAQFKNRDKLKEIWRHLWLDTHYQKLLTDSKVKNFADFENQVRERLTLNEGFQNQTYQSTTGVIAPKDGTTAVPKADLIILNQPNFLYDGQNLSHVAGYHEALGVETMIANQIKPGQGVIWAITDSPDAAHRLGRAVADSPQVSIPQNGLHFDSESQTMGREFQNYNYPRLTNQFLFPP